MKEFLLYEIYRDFGFIKKWFRANNFESGRRKTTEPLIGLPLQREAVTVYRLCLIEDGASPADIQQDI